MLRYCHAFCAHAAYVFLLYSSRRLAPSEQQRCLALSEGKKKELNRRRKPNLFTYFKTKIHTYMRELSSTMHMNKKQTTFPLCVVGTYLIPLHIHLLFAEIYRNLWFYEMKLRIYVYCITPSPRLNAVRFPSSLFIIFKQIVITEWIV